MGPRAFDPVGLARAEVDAWVAYYRGDLRGLLRASVLMVRIGFGMSLAKTVYGAYLTARGIRAWAPYPDNDPHRARVFMARFYRLVARDGGLTLDPARAARLEIDWWRVHRLHQRENALSEADLVASLVELYAYTYSATPEAVRPAAEHRMVAMRYSDEWHRGGCDLASPLIDEERSELVAAYTALLAAVGRG